MQTPTETPARISRLDDRRAKRPAIIDPNQFYGIDEVAAARDMSRAGVYKEIAAGLIQPTKEGARTKILGAEIIRRNQEVVGSNAA